MRERANELKGEVRQMFDADNVMSVADMVNLVDELQRLGIDNHFRKEINAGLSRIHSEELDAVMSNDLHTVALRFCLLRQHGFWVSTDVFDKFRDETGSFSKDLTGDTRGLLSLYNAAHMAVPGEATLDDAIAFARHHLEAAIGRLASPMAEQVARALEIPRPRFMRRLETMHYITEYEQEEAHSAILLELARVDLNLVRSLHLKELRTLSLWWRDLYGEVKLTYARDRIVEPYFYNFGVFHEENSHLRIIVTKVFVLLGLIDDTYDVHATLEDCQMLDEAIQRWNESAVYFLPEYLRMLYIKTLSNFNEIEDTMEPYDKYRMAYIKKQFKSQSKNYLQETKWFNDKYIPSLKEHVDVTLMSTGVPLLFFVALMAAGQVVTKETFEWAFNIPDMVRASGEMGRFLNDIASYKRGKNTRDVASTVECYMKEHGVTGEEAMVAIAAMVEQAWRRINRAYMEMNCAVEPAARWLLDMTRMLEIYYLRGRDGLTYGRDIKELVAFLFLKQIPV
ncbi:hypothetical protein HU200_004612 [Digitaria exilis]|uniref:Terpene synthase n=1 Tax=Digitaria exilis TaxID=1010633 RepID=A0A835KTF6_9POAL|nr:hypothetical protein HU200_004612 [Digitaria exilis]CAB3474912.1 unnamed protein product [Digitaria exilis]